MKYDAIARVFVQINGRLLYEETDIEKFLKIRIIPIDKYSIPCYNALVNKKRS